MEEIIQTQIMADFLNKYYPLNPNKENYDVNYIFIAFENLVTLCRK